MAIDAQEPKKKSNLAMWGGLVAGLLVLGAIAWGISSMMGSKKEAPKKAPKITLVAPPPPPPPPPPPKFEKKPDPPKEQKEMKVDQPVVKQEQAPPSPDLKMEGPAGDGPSAFGAGRVTNEDLSKVGKGSGGLGGKGGMFNPNANYANLLKGELQRYLSKNNALKRRRYAIDISVWVSANGGMERFELMGTTGDADTDDAIKKAVTELPSFTQKPPAGMPQPIRLRIITSGS